MKINISTARLHVRNFKPEDWRAVYEYTSNVKVMKYIPGGVFTEQQAQEFVLKHSGDGRQKGEDVATGEDEQKGEDVQNFAVSLTDERRLIGHISFHKYFGEHTYEIGWVFHPAYYRKGYATEAAKAIVQFGFEQMQLHRIIATCQPENTASYRIMEKIGMRREGFFEKCIPHGNEWWDEYYYAILHEEWMGAAQRNT